MIPHIKYYGLFFIIFYSIKGSYAYFRKFQKLFIIEKNKSNVKKLKYNSMRKTKIEFT